MEPVREGDVGLKRRRKYEKEGKNFTKPKSIIMMVGQSDSETGEIDKGKGTP